MNFLNLDLSAFQDGFAAGNGKLSQNPYIEANAFRDSYDLGEASARLVHHMETTVPTKPEDYMFLSLWCKHSMSFDYYVKIRQAEAFESKQPLTVAFEEHARNGSGSTGNWWKLNECPNEFCMYVLADAVHCARIKGLSF